MPLRKIIYEVGGGIINDKEDQGDHPWWVVHAISGARKISTSTWDFDSVAKLGSFLGSGGTVIIDEDTCMVQVALRSCAFTPMKAADGASPAAKAPRG